MRQSAIVCHLCVVPHVLCFPSTQCSPPPPWVKGSVAEHALTCTGRRRPIRAGSAFVYVCGESPVEGEAALHARLRGG